MGSFYIMSGRRDSRLFVPPISLNSIRGAPEHPPKPETDALVPYRSERSSVRQSGCPTCTRTLHEKDTFAYNTTWRGPSCPMQGTVASSSEAYSHTSSLSFPLPLPLPGRLLPFSLPNVLPMCRYLQAARWTGASTPLTSTASRRRPSTLPRPYSPAPTARWSTFSSSFI